MRKITLQDRGWLDPLAEQIISDNDYLCSADVDLIDEIVVGNITLLCNEDMDELKHMIVSKLHNYEIDTDEREDQRLMAYNPNSNLNF